MTVTIHPRETGATVRCNYHGCPHTLVTGQILVSAIRAYAKSVGWIRGLDKGSGDADGGRPSNRRWDICPEHAVKERRSYDERSAAQIARRKKRDELLAMPLPERAARAKAMRAEARKRHRAKIAERQARTAELVQAVSA